MSLFNKNETSGQPEDALKAYARHEKIFKAGRIALFVVFGFTLLNIIFLLMGSHRLLVYSAQLPLYFCSMAYSNIADEGEVILTALWIIISLVITAPYLIIGLMTKKKSRLMPAGVVCAFIDCFFMFMFGFFLYPWYQIIFSIAFLVFFIAAGFAEEKMRELNTPRKRKKAAKAQQNNCKKR